MQLLAGYVRVVSTVNRWVGLILSWLALAVVLVCFTVVDAGPLRLARRRDVHWRRRLRSAA
jgi:TRAP-type mannitol/chloroaromatic compound transport system permease small subunit